MSGSFREVIFPQLILEARKAAGLDCKVVVLGHVENDDENGVFALTPLLEKAGDEDGEETIDTCESFDEESPAVIFWTPGTTGLRYILYLVE